MKDIKFQYYAANIKKTKPLGFVTLERFMKAIQKPKPELITKIDQIRQASEAGNLELKTQLKEQLFFFTPTVVVRERRDYSNIAHFTGLMPLDFDKLDSKNEAVELKEAFFHSVESVVFAWLSSSGKGFRCLLKIPVVNSVEEYQAHFAAAQKMFGDVKGFDRAPKNAVLPLFISIDKNALIRWDAETFTEKIYPAKPQRQPVAYLPTGQGSRVLNLIERRINGIVDVGHPVVRATAFYVGGLVSAGHCSASEALSKLESCIRSHPYTGNPAKVKTYLKTMQTMFEKGMQQTTDFL
jgi:hypothetical protein